MNIGLTHVISTKIVKFQIWAVILWTVLSAVEWRYPNSIDRGLKNSVDAAERMVHTIRGSLTN